MCFREGLNSGCGKIENYDTHCWKYVRAYRVKMKEFSKILCQRLICAKIRNVVFQPFLWQIKKYILYENLNTILSQFLLSLQPQNGDKPFINKPLPHSQCVWCALCTTPELWDKKGGELKTARQSGTFTWGTQHTTEHCHHNVCLFQLKCAEGGSTLCCEFNQWKSSQINNSGVKSFYKIQALVKRKTHIRCLSLGSTFPNLSIKSGQKRLCQLLVLRQNDREHRLQSGRENRH